MSRQNEKDEAFPTIEKNRPGRHFLRKECPSRASILLDAAGTHREVAEYGECL